MGCSGASPMPDEEGLIWSQVKRQLYRSEVSHLKRLVGDELIQKNKLMSAELSALRQILSDFQEQNDELSSTVKKQVAFCGSQHRDLMRRQAQIMIDDLRSQAESAGHLLEDMLPELKEPTLAKFLECDEGADKKRFGNSFSSFHSGRRGFSPPETPSTRPSSSSGCSSTPEPIPGMHTLPLGRQLGLDELGAVAEGIREALEVEHATLLNSIGEQMSFLEAEEARRAASVSGAQRGEPSTAELQGLLHKLQDLAVSPTLRTLALTGPPSPTRAGFSIAPPEPKAIMGGASVRRLQALIADRRRGSGNLGAVPEAAVASGNAKAVAATKQVLDPFFDDPFA